MGPPPFGDGNAPIPTSTREPRTASMGPPPFGDGNSYLDLNSALSLWDRVVFAAEVSIIRTFPSSFRLKTAGLCLIRCER